MAQNNCSHSTEKVHGRKRSDQSKTKTNRPNTKAYSSMSDSGALDRTVWAPKDYRGGFLQVCCLGYSLLLSRFYSLYPAFLSSLPQHWNYKNISPFVLFNLGFGFGVLVWIPQTKLRPFLVSIHKHFSN